MKTRYPAVPRMITFHFNSQWKVNQISNREPVFKRKNRIEDRINEEIRLAAEKEAEFRLEKGLAVDSKILTESYNKEMEAAAKNLEKIEKIEAEIEKLETTISPKVSSSFEEEDITKNVNLENTDPEIFESQSDIEKFENLAIQVEMKQTDEMSNSGSEDFSGD